MAIVIIEGNAPLYAVAEVAPPEIVEKLRLWTVVVSATPALAPTETEDPAVPTSEWSSSHAQ